MQADISYVYFDSMAMLMRYKAVNKILIIQDNLQPAHNRHIIGNRHYPILHYLSPKNIIHRVLTSTSGMQSQHCTMLPLLLYSHSRKKRIRKNRELGGFCF